jgi:hypothetical protein
VIGATAECADDRDLAGALVHGPVQRQFEVGFVFGCGMDNETTPRGLQQAMSGCIQAIEIADDDIGSQAEPQRQTRPSICADDQVCLLVGSYVLRNVIG